MARPEMSFIERMTQVTNVAWGRKATGGWWVMWEQNGLPETTDFASAHGAQSFASWLDTTSGQPSVKDVQAAEKAFRELEEAVDEPPTPEQVREFRELGVPMMTPRERRRATHKLRQLDLGPVHVKRHARRR